jgi:hypothetical protein
LRDVLHLAQTSLEQQRNGRAQDGRHGLALRRLLSGLLRGL